MRFYWLFGFFLLLVLSACTKKETITEIEHQNVVIDGNTPPSYNGVTTVQINSYINKLFIDLIGREPRTDELDYYNTYLQDRQLSDAAKEEVINELMFSADYSTDYFDRFSTIYFAQYLQGLSQDLVQDQIDQFVFIIDLSLLNGDTLTAQYVDYELGKLTDLLDAAADYRNQAIDINQYMTRLANNYFYDQINMGSENYVLACFENFFKRLPTDVELVAGVTMVDGFASQLLLKDGSGKLDFLTIMTTTPAFYEGLCFDIYQQLFSRLPDSAEMTEAALELEQSRDFQAIQRKLMKTKEYVGS